MAPSTRRTLLALVLVVTGLFGSAPFDDVRALRLRADTHDICQQVPGLNDAIEYTLKTWPISGATVEQAGMDTSSRLVYFATALWADASYCTSLATGGDVALASQPDAVLGTIEWHFGMASVALLEYQRAVR